MTTVYRNIEAEAELAELARVAEQIFVAMCSRENAYSPGRTPDMACEAFLVARTFLRTRDAVVRDGRASFLEDIFSGLPKSL